jgi:hypothetical protein
VSGDVGEVSRPPPTDPSGPIFCVAVGLHSIVNVGSLGIGAIGHSRLPWGVVDPCDSYSESLIFHILDFHGGM